MIEEVIKLGKKYIDIIISKRVQKLFSGIDYRDVKRIIRKDILQRKGYYFLKEIYFVEHHHPDGIFSINHIISELS